MLKNSKYIRKTLSMRWLAIAYFFLVPVFIYAQGWDWALYPENNTAIKKHGSYITLLQTDSFGNSYCFLTTKDSTKIENTNKSNNSCCLNPVLINSTSYNKYLVKFNRKGKVVWHKILGNIYIKNSYLFNNKLYLYSSISASDSFIFGNNIVSKSANYSLSYNVNTGTELKLDYLFQTYSSGNFLLDGFITDNKNYYFNLINNNASGSFVQFSNKKIYSKPGEQLIIAIDKINGGLAWYNNFYKANTDLGPTNNKAYLARINYSLFCPVSTSDSNYIDNIQYPKILKLNASGVILKINLFSGSEAKLNYLRQIRSFGNNLLVVSGYIGSDQLMYDNQLIKKNIIANGLENFILAVDSNLNYKWHYVSFMTGSANPEFTIDSSGNVYLALQQTAGQLGIVLPDKSIFKIKNSSKNGSESIILKFDKNGEFIDAYSFPVFEASSYIDFLRSDQIGNVFVGIYSGLYDANIGGKLKIGDFEFEPTISILSKLNTHLLKINQDTLWCASDSLSAHYDTVAFKRLAWFFKDTLRQTGEKYRPNLTRTGKYKVRLTAYEWDSCSSTIGDSFMYYQPPKIKVTRPQIGCVYAPFWFTDSSYFDNYPNIQLQVKIDFGDGNDTTCFRYLADLKSFKLYHVYTDSGTYKITYTIMHQGCSNSFTTKVKILPAPRPGVVCLPAEGCTPLKIDFQRKYTDLIDSISWQISKHTMVFKGQPQNFTINNAGKFWLSQKIYGPTGCVTRDSFLLTVRQGMPANTKPYLIQATLLNNFNVEVMWQKVPHAAQYELYLPNGTSKRLIDTAFNQLFNSEINTPLTYTIRALDSCENPSMESNIGRTIYCTAKEIPGASKNDLPASVVSFTSYLDWREGVKNYTIETKFSTETVWQPLVSINDTSFADLQFTKANEFKKCYRINATSNSGVTSISNELCLPYQPVIFIPSAVTPNEDGLNDDFDFYTYGIENIHTEIYNRWGMKIWEGGKNEKWKPAINNMDGVYVYIINGKSASTGTPLQFKGTITVF